MAFTATEIYDLLTQLDNSDDIAFTLRDGVTESDVKMWYDGVDVASLEADIDSAIERTAVTDLTEPQGIGDDNLSVSDVISSRNDDPGDYEAAYLIRSNKTVVQYFKPEVGGREPIPGADVESWMADHVSDLVNQQVNATLLDRAQTEFGA